MQPTVASQLQTWWLHMTEFLVVLGQFRDSTLGIPGQKAI
jgi:hypothetical protein